MGQCGAELAKRNQPEAVYQCGQAPHNARALLLIADPQLRYLGFEQGLLRLAYPVVLTVLVVEEAPELCAAQAAEDPSLVSGSDCS